MEQDLSKYSWDMGEYRTYVAMSPSEQELLTMYDAQNVYRLNPAPPKLQGDHSSNDYIRQAQETLELKYIFFFLHENEAYFNSRINSFLLSRRGWSIPQRFMELKLDCKAEVLRQFPNYDPSSGATFITYIHHHISDVLFRYRMTEECYSFSSLNDYKLNRRIMQIFEANNGNSEETACIFARQYNCSEKTAARRLRLAWEQQNRVLPDRTNNEGEEKEQDDDLIAVHWDYLSILDYNVLASKMDEAYYELPFMDRTLLRKRNAIGCVRCGRVGDMRKRKTFEQLAEQFEATGTSGIEQAYKRALEKLLIELVARGQLHCVRIRQESIQCEGKKITAAVYSYQVDKDGEWGTIQFDLREKTAWVETFAEKDLCYTWEITDAAIQAVLESDDGKLPKKKLIPVGLE